MAYGRAQLAAIFERFTKRMHSLSEFMRGLLQRYTRWFNKRHGMRGTLWEDRFHSVIVQSGLTARTMAAYIDLNCPRSTHAMNLPICSSANVGDWAFGSAFSAGGDLQGPCRLPMEFLRGSSGWWSRGDEGPEWPCARAPGARRTCGNLPSLGHKEESQRSIANSSSPTGASKLSSVPTGESELIERE